MPVQVVCWPQPDFSRPFDFGCGLCQEEACALQKPEQIKSNSPFLSFSLLRLPGDPGKFSVQSCAMAMELALSAEVRLGAFCPTMDLLALVTSPDDQVSLWRLSWQKLFSISPAATVTSLAWRPDGKVLTLGLSSGSIDLINVETGEAFLQQSVAEAAVCCLSWLAVDSSKRRTRAEQPKPKGLQQSQPGLLAASRAPARPVPQAAVLCIIDISGSLQLATADLFMLAKIQLPDAFAAERLQSPQVRYDYAQSCWCHGAI